MMSKLAAPLKTCIVGSGNCAPAEHLMDWGSAIARIVGETSKVHSEFDERIVMWVFEEMIDGRKLSSIINTEHENVKYLPGKKLPSNVIANPSLVDSVKDADILIFVVPHQFVSGICNQIKGKLKPTALGVSLIKYVHLTTEYPVEEHTSVARGLKRHESLDCDDITFLSAGLAGKKPDGSIRLVTEDINEILGIKTSVLMGANLAPEVAAGNFCEATIGAQDEKHRIILKNLFQTDFFRISAVSDAHTVELCGALKNVVACGAGFSDGLGYGDNTKAAVIRLGLMEMTHFIEFFYPGSQLSTFFESCGIADLITTCYGGRNRKVSEAFVKTGKSLEELETELLGGQRLQGPHTASQVHQMLLLHNMRDKFPLFDAVHRICVGELKPDKFIDCLRDHPVHSPIKES